MLRVVKKAREHDRARGGRLRKRRRAHAFQDAKRCLGILQVSGSGVGFRTLPPERN
jgi:hypothetical protein